MTPPKLLMELEALCEEKGYRIRKEKGAFAGSDCLIEGERLIVLNTRRPVEFQVGVLSRVLRGMDLDGTFIKPAVRRELEKLWDRPGQRAIEFESGGAEGG